MHIHTYAGMHIRIVKKRRLSPESGGPWEGLEESKEKESDGFLFDLKRYPVLLFRKHL